MLLTLVTFNHVTGVNPIAPKTAQAAAQASKTAQIGIVWHTYEADVNTLNTALNSNHANWPQKNGNWCGVANIAAINDYDYLINGIDNQNKYPDQYSVANMLNGTISGQPSPISPWGSISGTPAFKANISKDGGTDPRSIAWGLYTVTPNNFFFHNYIYPGSNGVDHAVRNFASDFGPYNGLNDPISVTINGGQHSVVISGVIANEDPSYDPNGVILQKVHIWDPWFGFNGTTPYNTTGRDQWWYVSDFESAQNYPQWWGQTYNTSNGYDPEPSTTGSNYYNAPPLSHHWGGNYITIEQDRVVWTTYTENIALDNLGNPVPHN